MPNLDINCRLYRHCTPTIEHRWRCAIVPLKMNHKNYINDLIHWCEENCTGKWSYVWKDYANIAKFYFKIRCNYIAFVFVWLENLGE